MLCIIYINEGEFPFWFLNLIINWCIIHGRQEIYGKVQRNYSLSTYSFALSCLPGFLSILWTPLTKTRVQIQAFAWRHPSSTWSTLWFSPSSLSTSSWLWSSSPSRSRETRPCQSAAWRRMRCGIQVFLSHRWAGVVTSKNAIAEMQLQQTRRVLHFRKVGCKINCGLFEWKTQQSWIDLVGSLRVHFECMLLIFDS